MKRTLLAILALQLIGITGFLYFVYQSGEVMGKDGLGDLEKWKILTKYAGMSFYSVVTLWFSALFSSLITKHFKEKEAQFAIGMPPLLLGFGWILLLFI